MRRTAPPSALSRVWRRFMRRFSSCSGIAAAVFPASGSRPKASIPHAIGLVLAVPMLARVFAIPLAARDADRRDALRGHHALCACWRASPATSLVGFSSAALVIDRDLMRWPRASTRRLMPLAETYALKGLAARGRAYGPVRLWGSVAFIVGNFVAGFARHRSGARSDLADHRRASRLGARSPRSSAACRSRMSKADTPRRPRRCCAIPPFSR